MTWKERNITFNLSCLGRYFPACGRRRMRNSPKTVTTRETVSNWMACTSADRATAPGKYTGVPVQDCRQGHCSRQVHRRASTGQQTGPVLQASLQACQYRSADRPIAPGKSTGVPVQVSRQAQCSRQVYRRASIGLQTRLLLQASAQ
jgi:hypothetical protein